MALVTMGEMLADDGLPLVVKEDYVDERVRPRLPVAGHIGGGGKVYTKEEADELRNAKIAENPAYGRIICRCETITEGEIIDSIRRPLGARSLDGVKRRTRAGMGRCQGGFCSPRVMEILSRELGLPLDEITKSGGDSKIVIGRTKDEG